MYLNPKSQCSCFCGDRSVCAITAHMSEYLGHRRQSHQRQIPPPVPSHTNTHGLNNFHKGHNMHFKTFTQCLIEDDSSATHKKVVVRIIMRNGLITNIVITNKPQHIWNANNLLAAVKSITRRRDYDHVCQ